MTSSNRFGPPAARVPHASRRGLVVHLFRVGLFVALVCLIRQQHVRLRAGRARGAAAAVPIARVRPLFPAAAVVSDPDLALGRRTVADAAGTPLGYYIVTSPASDRIVGFSGPTNALVAFDTQDRILGIEILQSGDTPEHVRDVLGDRRFMSALVGCTWQQAAAWQIDGVSGATLTSLAVVEGIRARLGGSRDSLRFPRPLELGELKRFFPAAVRLAARADRPRLVDVYDAGGRRLGAAVRTAPATDNIVGYQGPTDMLLALDTDDRVIGLAVRSSYDNQPYVDYTGADEPFRARFRHMLLDELSRFDPDAAGIEGVSGATMTSMAVARGLPQAARAALGDRPRPRMVVSARDLGTAAVLLVALLICFSPLRANRRLRAAFQVLLVVYLGLLNGDMLSQAMLVGWAQSGAAPWRLAPGLALLSAAALLVPVFSRRQLYCRHICPFGAAQQLLRRWRPWRVPLAGWRRRGLAAIPFSLLLLVVATAMVPLPVNLAGIEPFDAFVFWIAGSATLGVAIAGLAAAAVVPMAYCRFGCPTGAMLNYLRFRGANDRLSRRDALAAALLGLALLIRCVSSL